MEASGRLDVTRYRISPANWPRDLKLKIGLLGDVHAGEKPSSLKRARGRSDQLHGRGVRFENMAVAVVPGDEVVDGVKQPLIVPIEKILGVL